ncbi:crossover junction endodeoxyribonuclease RuvC [Candidatus Azobacteroides pseudotrichonymphae]|uniref:Crossover junction endodeoxyribonuclease RuvC n=1 Tax=Azobacteroides pseudotrichonymphae genomovar. CFP2 TaxID=511995 RepID=B6YQD1_AZOPC|nr:crossover junction endodeoxyribonuclease RuvC [Candidatus Azobacteroides pseudotrichonymphae]BAG83403.1 crossover junction endodeoxyribonuclease RuvC [Candidatus Azobacteroides pseudotrichonymphae genomovar. CFP2]
MREERIILGVDPGTSVMGYGLIRISEGNPFLLKMEVFKLNKSESHYKRLLHIFNKILELIDEFFPNELAIESPFLGQNVQSMLKLGRVQGVVIAAAMSRSISVYEYTPLKIKMAVTGNGRASKEQVAGILRNYLRLSKDRTQLDEYLSLDATDGLATALCHFFQGPCPVSETRYVSWKDFLKRNTKKIRK